MSLSMALCVATMENTDRQYPGEIKSWMDLKAGHVQFSCKYNTPENNSGVVGSYQLLYEDAKERGFDVLVMAHDDVIMREEGWDARLLQEFADPTVGVVGFGGAIRHGHTDLYRVPYQLPHLARSGYISNVDDAEVHGERFTGARDCAVLDGFVLAIRRDLLVRAGGWRAICGPVDFFGYDYSASAMAHRLGYRVRVVGVRCHHLGGQTSVKVKDNPITGQQAYDESHRWFYENFRDTMPFRCD